MQTARLCASLSVLGQSPAAQLEGRSTVADPGSVYSQPCPRHAPTLKVLDIALVQKVLCSIHGNPNGTRMVVPVCPSQENEKGERLFCQCTGSLKRSAVPVK